MLLMFMPMLLVMSYFQAIAEFPASEQSPSDIPLASALGV